MGYLALYRRFRPQGFDKLVGQDAVVRTLKNQIAEDRIGHAYLFCGARGTGKTSAAKIFARAINCTSPVNGSPCGKCAACVALSGSNIDVVEMDAASNNKVEEVRDIRENVQYPPVSCRYKVYIIDEVHMLTDSAFNALLKTLEEPPKHAVFVLATTEPQKLPATILSRCMRFDFKLIETPVIASLVADIYREVGKDFEEEAVYAIAKAGNGSVRDALSVADVCLSCGEGKLTYRDVTEVLGAADRDKTAQLVRALLEGKEGDALFSIDHLVKSGKNVFLLAKDTVGVLRDLLVIKNCTTAAAVLNYPAEELAALTELAALADAKRIVRMVEIFTELDGKMRYSASPRVMLEAAALKAARPETDFDMAALLFRVNALTDEVAKLKEELATAKTLAAQAPVMQQPMQAPVMQTAQAESLRQDEPARELAPTVEENRSAPTEEPVQAESKKQQAPQKPQTPDYSELAGLEPPPEEDFVPEGYVSAASAVKKEQAPAPVAKGKLLGALIRKLRTSGKHMLWVACTELKGDETDDALTLFADETAYGVLVKEDNFNALKAVLATLSQKELYLRKIGERPDSFKQDVESLKKTFGSDLITVREKN